MSYLDDIATDIRNAVPTDALPEEDTKNLLLSYAVLLLAKGETVTGEDVHNAWVAWTLCKGEDHEMLVPFSDLPSNTQAEDSPYVLAIKKVARNQAHSCRDRGNAHR